MSYVSISFSRKVLFFVVDVVICKMVQNKVVSVQTTNAYLGGGRGGEECECIALLDLNHGTRRR